MLIIYLDGLALQQPAVRGQKAGGPVT